MIEHIVGSPIRQFTNTNFCQFQASVKAKYCYSVTFCLINSLDLQFFAPTEDWGEQKFALVNGVYVIRTFSRSQDGGIVTTHASVLFGVRVRVQDLPSTVLPQTPLVMPRSLK